MQKDTQLIGNLVSLAKNKIVEAALNNPEKIGEFVAELALKNDATRTFLKSMDWSAESFGKTVESLVSGGIRAYQNREGFRSTDAERMEKFASVFAEISGYGCLTPIEARILAAGYAKFNGREIQKIFKLESRMSVEQVQQAAWPPRLSRFWPSAGLPSGRAPAATTRARAIWPRNRKACRRPESPATPPA